MEEYINLTQQHTDQKKGTIIITPYKVPVDVISREGTEIEKRGSRVIRSTEYRNDMKNGEEKEFYESTGSVSSLSNWVDDNNQGEVKYHKNGKISNTYNRIEEDELEIMSYSHKGYPMCITKYKGELKTEETCFSEEEDGHKLQFVRWREDGEEVEKHRWYEEGGMKSEMYREENVVLGIEYGESGKVILDYSYEVIAGKSQRKDYYRVFYEDGSPLVRREYFPDGNLKSHIRYGEDGSIESEIHNEEDKEGWFRSSTGASITYKMNGTRGSCDGTYACSHTEEGESIPMSSHECFIDHSNFTIHPHGTEKIKSPNGSSQVGKWIMGRKNGICITHHADEGSRTQEEWFDGMLIKSTMYNASEKNVSVFFRAEEGPYLDRKEIYVDGKLEETTEVCGNKHFRTEYNTKTGEVLGRYKIVYDGMPFFRAQKPATWAEYEVAYGESRLKYLEDEDITT